MNAKKNNRDSNGAVARDYTPSAPGAQNIVPRDPSPKVSATPSKG